MNTAIIRRGISELWSGCKTEYNSAIHACTQESYAIQTCEYVKKQQSVEECECIAKEFLRWVDINIKL